MGRVFSYEDIATGKVPQLEDFTYARELFVDEVCDGVEDGYVDGGFVFGSVGRGTPDIRSDFDTLIVLSDNSIDSYRAAREITRRISLKTDGRVPMEPIVYPKDTLAEGRHELNHVFGKHLSGEHRLVVGNDPADYMTFPELTVRAIFEDYVYQKARKLSNIYVKTSIESVGDNGLQRTLEIPNSLGRKATQMLYEVGYLAQSVEASEKPAVHAQSAELFSKLDLYDGYSELSKANVAYTAFLRETVNGNVDEATYNDELRHLHDKMPLAIEWIRKVGKAVCPLLSQ